jgi:antitoxin component YwqK of YwqJK toxin-antitoxin module
MAIRGPLTKCAGLIALLAASCSHPAKQQAIVRAPLWPKPDSVFVRADEALLKNENGIWHYGRDTFNGYIQEMDSGKIASCIPVVKGREWGIAYGWYANGAKKFQRSFICGKREGTHTGWHRNGVVSFLLHFKDDKYEGTQQSFFEDGRLQQELRYSVGYEEGRQQTWNDSGRLINNYTVKNGKLYGVVGRYDCISVHGKKP